MIYLQLINRWIIEYDSDDSDSLASKFFFHFTYHQEQIPAFKNEFQSQARATRGVIHYRKLADAVI